MGVIKNFLYNNLSFSINSGVGSVIVGNAIKSPKLSTPQVTWDVAFGIIKPDLFNLIQQELYGEDEPLWLLSFISPKVNLYKVTSGLEQFYTYVYAHEQYFFGTNAFDLIHRKISFTSDGTFDNLIGCSCRVPIAGITDITGMSLLHYVHPTSRDLRAKHIGVGLFDTSISLVELMEPSDLTGYTITYKGTQNASDSGIL